MITKKHLDLKWEWFRFLIWWREEWSKTPHDFQKHFLLAFNVHGWYVVRGGLGNAVMVLLCRNTLFVDLLCKNTNFYQYLCTQIETDMKKSFIVIIMFFAALVLFSCQNGSIKSYYLIMYTPAVVHEHDGQFKQSKPSVEIKSLPSYHSDSIAIVSEKQSAEEWLAGLSDRLDEKVRELEDKHSPEVAQIMVSAVRDSYDELSNTKFTLLILSHEENYDPSELLSVIKENGIVSSQTRHYIQEHQLEVSFEPLN